MASVKGKRTEGSIKELIDSLSPKPSWHCQNLCFDLPTGEGAPSKKEGVGGDF